MPADQLAPALLGDACDTLVEALFAGAAVVDAEGRVLTSNTSWRKWTAGDATGRRYLDVCGFVGGADADAASAIARGLDAVLTGERRRWQARYSCHLSGENGLRWVRVLISALKEESLLKGAVILHLDITEQVQAREAVETQALKYQAIFEGAGDAITIMNDEGRILSANPAACALLGGSLDELRRANVKEFQTPLVDLGKAWTRTLHRGHSDGLYAIRRLDGEIRTIEVKTKASILPNQHLNMFRDVTDRIEAERRLQYAEARFRTVFDRNPQAVYLVDMDSQKMVGANPAFEALTGYPRDEWLDSTLAFQIWPDEATRAAGTAKLLADGYLHQWNDRLRTRSGKLRDVLVSCEFIVLEPNTRLVAIFITDETARHQLETQFRQAQKLEALGRLSGGVAHDFNNLLTVILGVGGLMLSDLDEGQVVQRSDLEDILSAGRSAESLTRQLLAFSRRQVLQPRVLDLNEVVLGTESMLRRALGEDVALETRLSAEPLLLKADQGQLEQVIMNLAINARDAMPRGGRLTLQTAFVQVDDTYAETEPAARTGRHVQLTVADTGSGMDAETQERIFEPFFTTKEEGRGTGLGLSTVFGIVQQSGGWIRVYSEPGHGTTFRIYLPAQAAGVDTAPLEATVEDDRRRTGTILLVEDKPEVRKVARTILERHGYTVLEAEDGRQAIDLAASHQASIDLLLTDVVMPDMPGPALAKSLKQTRDDLRVLCMSGYTDIRAHGLTPDRDSPPLLQKPFTASSLLSAVQRALAE